jgi:hypothetical protein
MVIKLSRIKMGSKGKSSDNELPTGNSVDSGRRANNI